MIGPIAAGATPATSSTPDATLRPAEGARWGSLRRPVAVHGMLTTESGFCFRSGPPVSPSDRVSA